MLSDLLPLVLMAACTYFVLGFVWRTMKGAVVESGGSFDTDDLCPGCGDYDCERPSCWMAAHDA